MARVVVIWRLDFDDDVSGDVPENHIARFLDDRRNDRADVARELRRRIGVARLRIPAAGSQHWSRGDTRVGLTEVARRVHERPTLERGVAVPFAAGNLSDPLIAPEINGLSDDGLRRVAAPDHERVSLKRKSRAAILRFAVERIARKPHHHHSPAHLGIRNGHVDGRDAVGVGHAGRDVRAEREVDRTVRDRERGMVGAAVRQARRQRDVARREKDRAGVREIRVVTIDDDRRGRLRRGKGDQKWNGSRSCGDRERRVRDAVNACRGRFCLAAECKSQSAARHRHRGFVDQPGADRKLVAVPGAYRP